MKILKALKAQRDKRYVEERLQDCDFAEVARTLTATLKGKVLPKELIILLNNFIGGPSMETAWPLIHYDKEYLALFYYSSKSLSFRKPR